MISALPTFLGSVRSPAVPCVCCLLWAFLIAFLHSVGVFSVGVFTFLWAFFIPVGVFTFAVYLHLFLHSVGFFVFTFCGCFYIL
jgi:hypothetical protein